MRPLIRSTSGVPLNRLEGLCPGHFSLCICFPKRQWTNKMTWSGRQHPTGPPCDKWATRPTGLRPRLQGGCGHHCLAPAAHRTEGESFFQHPGRQESRPHFDERKLGPERKGTCPGWYGYTWDCSPGPAHLEPAQGLTLHIRSPPHLTFPPPNSSTKEEEALHRAACPFTWLTVARGDNLDPVRNGAP